MRINPSFAAAYNNLGNILKFQGLLDEAIACFEKVLELEPVSPAAHCNLVYTLYFRPDQDAKAFFAEHRRWNRQHAEPLAKFIQPHVNEPSGERRLRIGYLSPDFSQHPVGRFLLPLLEAHDHDHFEIFCYSSLNFPDALTGLCRNHADVWREVHGLTDEHVASILRQDRIDILVDLTMHMSNSRLLVFARKPALYDAGDLSGLRRHDEAWTRWIIA